MKVQVKKLLRTKFGDTERRCCGGGGGVLYRFVVRLLDTANCDTLLHVDLIKVTNSCCSVEKEVKRKMGHFKIYCQLFATQLCTLLIGDSTFSTLPLQIFILSHFLFFVNLFWLRLVHSFFSLKLVPKKST